MAGNGKGWGVDKMLDRCGCMAANCTFSYFLRECEQVLQRVVHVPLSSVEVTQVKSLSVPQLDYVQAENGHMLVNFVGRTEALQAHFAAAMIAAGNNESHAWTCARSLPHITHNSSHAPFRSYYRNSATLDVATRLFATDRLTFNYSLTDEAAGPVLIVPPEMELQGPLVVAPAVRPAAPIPIVGSLAGLLP